jgi:hypothetical protein
MIVALAMTGCDRDHANEPLDLARPADLAVEVDLAVPDLSTAPDLTLRLDFAVPVDLSPTPDLAPRCRVDADCALPHATAACAAGNCRIVSCDQGWDDCDHLVDDGCETPIVVDNKCGCGHACECRAKCVNNVCVFCECLPGFACCSTKCFCDADLLNDPANCGGCGIACAQGQKCVNGLCK